VLRLSFTVDATPTDYVPLLAVTTALSLGVLALVAVFVRRQDRE
jgi:hypothetical protein